MHVRSEHGSAGTGVEVLLPTPPDPPHCVHGPALLFERWTQDAPLGDSAEGRVRKKFYACSAYRSRKECPLYVLQEKGWSQDKLQERRQLFGEERRARKWYLRPAARSEHVQTVRTAGHTFFCRTCSVFILPPDEVGLHGDHNTVKTNYKTVTTPSTLLDSLTRNEGNAQYLFNEDTTNFITRLLGGKKYSHLLCLGTPRVHEQFATRKKQPRSMLLDLDDRYLQFYPPTTFQHYNLSSSYFYEDDGPGYLAKFLSKASSLAIVVDPPFGALARVVGHGIDTLKRQMGELCPGLVITTYWIFPYFLAKHIAEVQPGLKMCHMPVEYDNHPVFKKGNNYTKSPVRIFTDRALSELPLPSPLYKHCPQCCAYVPSSVRHCAACGTCPALDRATKHCVDCGRCVREHYEHCETCEGCRPTSHHCKPPAICHRCQQPGHKRRYCPLLTDTADTATDTAPDTTPIEDKVVDGKSYFTITSKEEKKRIRNERKRKRKDDKEMAKKSKTVS